MTSELAAADAVRQLSDAPAPSTETANSVAESVALLTQMMQQANDYEESAFAAQSDSESSTEKKSRRKSSRRNNSRNSRNRSRSRDSRGSKKSINKACPHCTKYKRRTTHDNIPNDKCHWNKNYKGFRPKWICDEMDLKYVGRHEFSSDMGGYPSDSDDE